MSCMHASQASNYDDNFSVMHISHWTILSLLFVKMGCWFLLFSGLRDDHIKEKFQLRHELEGKMFPCRYIKIGLNLHLHEIFSEIEITVFFVHPITLLSKINVVGVSETFVTSCISQLTGIVRRTWGWGRGVGRRRGKGCDHCKFGKWTDRVGFCLNKPHGWFEPWLTKQAFAFNREFSWRFSWMSIIHFLIFLCLPLAYT